MKQLVVLYFSIAFLCFDPCPYWALQRLNAAWWTGDTVDGKTTSSSGVFGHLGTTYPERYQDTAGDYNKKSCRKYYIRN